MSVNSATTDSTISPLESKLDWGWVLLFLALLSMAALLAPAVTAGPLALDEYVSFWMIDADDRAGIWERCLNYGAVPPLASYLQLVSVRIMGQTELALRMPSLLFAWASIPLVFLLGRQIGGSLCGGLAAILLAWHPDVIDEVRIGRCYGLELFLATALVLVTGWWKNELDLIRRAVIWYLIATALLWTHYTSAILVAMTGGYLLFRATRTEYFRRELTVVGITLLAVIVSCRPLLEPVMRLRELGPYINMKAPAIPFWQTISKFWWLGLTAGLIVHRALRRRTSPDNTNRKELKTDFPWLMLICSVVPLVLLAILAVGDLSSLSNPRYRVIYFPAGVVWVSWLFTHRGGNRSAVAAVFITLAAAWVFQPLAPWQLGRLGSPADRDWHEINVEISQSASPKDLVLVQGGLVESIIVPAFLDDPLFLEYVACRASSFQRPISAQRWGLPYFWDDDNQREFADQISRFAPERLWIIGCTDTDLNIESTQGASKVAVLAGYLLKQERKWRNALVWECVRESP